MGAFDSILDHHGYVVVLMFKFPVILGMGF